MCKTAGSERNILQQIIRSNKNYCLFMELQFDKDPLKDPNPN